MDPIIGSFGFPEPLLQRRTYSTFRCTISQLIKANPERSRRGCGKEFVPSLDELVIAEVAAESSHKGTIVP